MSKITINAHSSIRIEGSKKTIYVDPYKIEEDIMDANIILFTHPHYDHMDAESVSKISKIDTVYVCPKSIEAEFLDAGMDTIYYYTIEPGQSINANGLHVEAIPSYNIGKEFHKKEKNWLGYIIELDGERIYIAGDSDLTEEMKAVKCDVALLPVGGTYTMNAKEAAEAANIIRPKVAIPTHYGSVAGNPEDGLRFKELVDKEIEVRILIEKNNEED